MVTLSTPQKSWIHSQNPNAWTDGGLDRTLSLGSVLLKLTHMSIRLFEALDDSSGSVENSS